MAQHMLMKEVRKPQRAEGQVSIIANTPHGTPQRTSPPNRYREWDGDETEQDNQGPNNNPDIQVS